jgi:adenosyl cobinamide kinase/adenosyl cobinamide phosphate guanylyltransferase
MPKVKEYVNNPGSQGGEDEGDDETTKEHRDAIGDGGSYNSNCTCGRLSSSDIKLNPINHCDNNNLSSRNNKKKNNIWLESSFVHLMTPINIRTKTLQNTNDNHHHQQQQHRQQSQHGFLEQHQHLLQLLEVAYTHKNQEDNALVPHNDNDHDETKDIHNGMVELCVDCIDRLASAFDTDTQRLYAEVEIYNETVLTSRQRMKALQRTTEAVSGVSSSVSADIINNNPIEEAYKQEIALLEQEVQARCDELFHLNKLYNEQKNITTELDLLEEGLQMEQNSLELQSEAFDNRRQILTKTLSEVQNEVDKLTCVSLPRALFDLQVDHARGLHYPLINQLRLAFRPKGDVPKHEIQVAWSQATQLLLILGTMFEYHGLDWKLVPLVDCAKLIYRKEIFNLAPGDCLSLMAWNALLDQVVKHALSIVGGGGINATSTTSSRVGGSSPIKNQSYNNSSNNKSNKESSTSPIPPFSSSATMIGGTEIARLEPSDDVGWSLVIHKMVSNLLWLSNRASDLAATQVSSMAHCVI